MYETNNAVVEDTTTPSVNESQVNEKTKKKFKWGKLVGYFFLLLLLAGSGYLGYRFYMFKPYRVTVSNVTSRSATISWVTEDPNPGVVLFREDKTLLPIWISPYGMSKGFDDRDYSNAELEAAEITQANIAKSGEVTADDIETEVVITQLDSYWTHHIVVRNLDPNTEYEFLVGDGLVFETSNSRFSTDTELESINTPISAYGTVRYFNSGDELYIKASDSVVYATLTEEISGIESELISSVTNITGGWYLDLSNVNDSEGENFLQTFSTEEVAIIKLQLTLENGWLGRWTKEIDLVNSAPADTIDLYDIEIENESFINDDKDLEYEGVFFDETSLDSLSLVKKADAWCVFGVGTTCPKTTTPKKTTRPPTALKAPSSTFASTRENNVTRLENQQRVSAANLARNQWEREIRKDPTPEREIEIVKHLAQSEADKNVATKALENNTIVERATVEEVQTEVDNITTTRKMEDITIETTVELDLSDLNKAKGQCGNDDVCKPIDGGLPLQCGYFNDSSCNCKCTNETVSVEWGGKCSCSLSGDTIIEHRPPTMTQTAENAVEKTETNRCPNDISGRGAMTCLSSAGCWYSAGYYSRRTFADSGYSCKAGEDGKSWRWAGDGVNYDVGEGSYIIGTETTGTGTSTNTEPLKLTETSCYEDTITGRNLVGMEDGITYKCRSNKWVKAINSSHRTDTVMESGGNCAFTWETTIIDGKLYECNGAMEAGKSTVWRLSKSNALYEIGIKVDNTFEQKVCVTGSEGYEKCACRQLNVTTQSNILGERHIEDGDYNVVLINPEDSCPGNEKGAHVLGVDVKTYAQGNESGKYILDTNTGIINGFKPGLFSFEYDGDTFMINVSEDDYEANNGSFIIYLDKNNDGEIDEGTEILNEEISILTISAETEGFTYSLKEGFNFISIPFIIKEGDIKMASELLEVLNSKYDNTFYSISQYDSGKWKMVGSNTGNFNQNDFQVLPGQGYVLKVSKDIAVTLYGNEVTYDSISDSAPIRFMPGWNLVGLYGSSVRSYTAESLLQDITTYQPVDFTAVNVSRWQENRALYEALQRDEDDTVYGLDFPIELKRSYFVKVTKGEGNWEPGIQ